MAALRADRFTGLFRPKPIKRESKKIYSYADAVFERTGGATPELVDVFKVYLRTKKSK